MKETNMTALVSAFARAYHARADGPKVFDDPMAEALLVPGEFEKISRSMSAGIQFFNPAFQGSPDEALRWIVEHQLAPTPLERASFAETALENAVRLGARQYLILGAGYDTFALRRPDWAESLRIFELDRPASSREKQERLRRAGIAAPEGAFFLEADFNEADWQHVLTECPAFSSGQRSFCSLLGLTYYIPEETFCRLLADLGALLLPGSSLAFDYPCRENSGSRGRRQAALAAGAGEPMCAAYSLREMETMLARCGFSIREHLDPPALTARCFAAYNEAHPDHPMTAFEGVCCCLAVRQPDHR